MMMAHGNATKWSRMKKTDKWYAIILTIAVISAIVIVTAQINITPRDETIDLGLPKEVKDYYKAEMITPTLQPNIEIINEKTAIGIICLDECEKITLINNYDMDCKYCIREEIQPTGISQCVEKAMLTWEECLNTKQAQAMKTRITSDYYAKQKQTQNINRGIKTIDTK